MLFDYNLAGPGLLFASAHQGTSIQHLEHRLNPLVMLSCALETQGVTSSASFWGGLVPLLTPPSLCKPPSPLHQAHLLLFSYQAPTAAHVLSSAREVQHPCCLSSEGSPHLPQGTKPACKGIAMSKGNRSWIQLGMVEMEPELGTD